MVKLDNYVFKPVPASKRGPGRPPTPHPSPAKRGPGRPPTPHPSPAKRGPGRPPNKNSVKQVGKTTAKQVGKPGRPPVKKTPVKQPAKTPVKSRKVGGMKSILIRRPRRGRKKKVKFHDQVRVKNIVRNECEKDCILNRGSQILLHNCSIAHERIAHMINEHSFNKILRTNEQDEPVKVFDMGTLWFNDNSPMILYNKLQDPKFMQKFIVMFDIKVRNNQKVGQIKSLEIKNNRFRIMIPRVIRTK